MALYRFGPFEFDERAGELRRGRSRVRLRPQPARALAHLLARHGEFVSRGELQRAIWPDGTYVHFDHGLNSCLKQIRAALGDSRSAPRFVETLVRRGFRFVAPVTAVSSHVQAAALHRTRIRVLPVRSLGEEDAGGASIAEGLGEEIVAELAGASPAGVAVVAAVPALGGCAAADEPELPVDFLVAATVRTAGNRLRVTSQMIDARTQCHVWAGRFDASLDRPLDAQAVIAKGIVGQVIAALGGDEDEDDRPPFETARAVQGRC